LCVTKEAWSVELYALNLTNVIKSTFTSDAQFSLQENITRRRTGGQNRLQILIPGSRKTGDAHRSLVYG